MGNATNNGLLAGSAGTDSRRARRRQLLRIGGLVWVALVLAWFAVEAVRYTGLFEKLSEWEFATFDRSWPLLTYAALAFVFAVPGLALRRLASDEPDPALIEDMAEHQARASARTLRAVGIGFAVGAVLCLVPIALLPRLGGPAPVIAAGVPSAGSGSPSQGAVRLTGDVLLARTATLEQNLVVTRRELRVAPVMPAPGEREVRYLVQVIPIDTNMAVRGPVPMQVAGALMHQGLPGSLRSLYRDAGVPLAPKVSVLYRYGGSMRRPYLVTALQCALVALFVLVLSLWQSRHARALAERRTARVLDLDPGMDLPDGGGLRPVSEIPHSLVKPA